MSDKTSQIIDLGEALKRSMNERSTGEVAAPGMFPDDSYMSNPRNVRKHAEAEREQIGAKAERAAVVKYLRKRAEGQPHVYDKQQINNLAYAIEKGAHTE